MQFQHTHLQGAWIIDPEWREDLRGGFARSFCVREFEAVGLPTTFVQCNMSRNTIRGTLRGLHWQEAPFAEGKLVRCTRGAVYDVMVDIRPHSPTYMQYLGVELSEQNGRAVYIPEGFAHGYQSLTNDSEVFYMVTASYHPPASSGLRWNDPAIAIDWPIGQPILSERDSNWELLTA